MIDTVLLAILAFASAGCLGVGCRILTFNRAQTQAAIAAMNGLNETYKLGFEALVLDNRRLTERVALIEAKLGLRPRNIDTPEGS